MEVPEGRRSRGRQKSSGGTSLDMKCRKCRSNATKKHVMWAIIIACGVQVQMPMTYNWLVYTCPIYQGSQILKYLRQRKSSVVIFLCELQDSVNYINTFNSRHLTREYTGKYQGSPLRMPTLQRNWLARGILQS